MDCPDASALQALISARTRAPAHEPLWGHIDGCGLCQKVLVALAADAEAPPPEDRSLTGAALESTAAAAWPGDNDETRWERGSVRAGLDPLIGELVQGTRIGRYVVEAYVGGGGFGVVLSAVDPELGRRVALKLLRSNSPRHAADNARLAREAQAMARITHPNVVAVYDAGVWRD